MILISTAGAFPDLAYADDFTDKGSYYVDYNDAVYFAGTSDILYQTYQPKWCVRSYQDMLPATACMHRAPGVGTWPSRVLFTKRWGCFSASLLQPLGVLHGHVTCPGPCCCQHGADSAHCSGTAALGPLLPAQGDHGAPAGALRQRDLPAILLLPRQPRGALQEPFLSGLHAGRGPLERPCPYRPPMMKGMLEKKAEMRCRMGTGSGGITGGACGLSWGCAHT